MNLVKDKYIADTTFKIDSHLLNFLIYQFKRKFTLSPLEIKGLSYVICSTFLEQATFSPKKNTNADLLQKMLNYILQNYTSDVSLKSMSQALGYEEHYLSRCFHKHFTFNFKDFINQLRVSESKKLLQGTNLSVTEISYRCGFNSIRNFNRNFLRECGVSPQVYRKSLIKSTFYANAASRALKRQARREIKFPFVLYNYPTVFYRLQARI